jgi:hypothetical protein
MARTKRISSLGSELELAYINYIATGVNRKDKAQGKRFVKERDQASIDIRTQSLDALEYCGLGSYIYTIIE